MPKSVPGKSSTAVIYIGQKRYQELAKQARTELLRQLLAEKQKE